jgi:hypothetical protein
MRRKQTKGKQDVTSQHNEKKQDLLRIASCSPHFLSPPNRVTLQMVIIHGETFN